MNYEQAIKYIHSVSNFFCKPGLDRIRQLCQGLGNPQDELKFIHVAGTNGKGSFCAMLDSILRAQGYKVGLFTSPYVRVFNERMRVNGENIPDKKLADLTERAKTIADKMIDKPTEFELITAIAFDYFKSEKCDLVILEVGMGGRLDATNVIKASLLSVITGIALDHTAFLGDTTKKIAAEKAGIIKENSIVLYGGEDSDAEAVISEFATKMQTKLYKTDYSKLKIRDFSLNGSLFDYRERSNIFTSLLGSYQPKNASIVLDSIDILNNIGLEISEDAVLSGLREARWPARFEIVSENPRVIFDGGHNAQGIEAAVESIRLYFGNEKPVVLTGVLKDKEYEKIAKNISSIASAVFTITPSNPRALPAEEYAKVFEQNGVLSVPCVDVENGVRLGRSAAEINNTALVCLGSLYTYGEIIGYLE